MSSVLIKNVTTLPILVTVKGLDYGILVQADGSNYARLN
ncbi:hypothetical protein Aocu_01410 [Acholeplasma oculi]|uniref:Uncharacterized protein n=1 Tax=Acholeplasma oculi TaxID=35623 RepID=A0A061AA11_9MOLU|nr:hypothetical protein Aocu_01410 [Acholeplasma oculi]